MIELHVTYTMKPGIRPKAFYDALNVEIWEDKDSLKAHQQTPHFKAMPAIKDQFVEKTDCVRYDTL